MVAALPPALPVVDTPRIVQPAPYQASFGRVVGSVPAWSDYAVLLADGRRLAVKAVDGTRVTFQVTLPRRDVTLRLVAVGRAGRRASSRRVGPFFGLPPAGAPRATASRQDAALARRVRALTRAFPGISAVYVQDLVTGRGAAWNARARFPAASTLKLAIAVTALRRLDGKPAVGSRVSTLLRTMLVLSDNDAANELEAWIGGSVFAGSARVDETMRALGLHDTLMYGGYESARRPAAATAPIPVRVEQAPDFGVGKYSTAADLARLARALYLAAAGKGPLLALGVTASEARHLLWTLAQVPDRGKLGRFLGPSTSLLHKAGWLPGARHDVGVVAFPEGVFVAAVLTWRSGSADLLAGEVAREALTRIGGP
jgi:beta-lactamase class A